jgi:site-specific DNA recombinase
MGVKNIVNHLNKHRMFTRNGGRWGIGQLHRVLTRRTYIGEHRVQSPLQQGRGEARGGNRHRPRAAADRP